MRLGLNKCKLCPRNCGADRSNTLGFCGASSNLEVASVCLHRGEEPPLNPIVNLFFAHCNLHCIYCQNYQISGAGRVESGKWKVESVESLAERICSAFSTLHSLLSTPMLGLVTAAHYAHHIPALIQAIKQSSNQTITPTIVYNSSGYESIETLRSLEGLVDIYLPDFKYIDPALAAAYSHAPDYPEVATAALREMIRQVGIGLKIDDQGRAYRGLIVRHLVLPGHVDNSLRVLDHLSTLRPPLSTLHVSLMAQYYPPHPGLPAPLDRTLREDEYRIVADRYRALGFDGWLQELQSENNYRPDFSLENPFKTL